MTRWFLLVLVGFLVLISGPAAVPQPPGRSTPRLEPVADLALIMEGLNQANYRGLAKLLKEPPDGAEAWAFARGQALLIAETGNLLMLRPPRSPEGRAAWLDHAADLRDRATRLARAAADRDVARSRAGLADLAIACNRCHETFRVPVRVPSTNGRQAPNPRPPAP